MRIGILTFHRAYNYGAFLQAYALKSFLEKNGYVASFIDYWPFYHEKFYNIWGVNNSGLKSLLRSILVARKKRIRYIGFIKNQKKYLGLSANPKYHNPEDLNNIEYDVIIYGSDQIWWKSRLGHDGFDDVYWGQHITQCQNKVVYAASMGIINLTEQDKYKIAEYLKNFSRISVRELQLKDVIQPMTENNISVVLDPTLLVPSSFWISKCSKGRPVKEKYILYYRMIASDKADMFSKELSKKFNLPVILISGNIDSYKASRINITTTPISFLSLIKNAEYVISTSFHGVALSIQFQKEFFTMGMGNNSGRVFSLLHALNLENRIVDNISTDRFPSIDYNIVQNRLEQLREQSKNYLINSIQV